MDSATNTTGQQLLGSLLGLVDKGAGYLATSAAAKREAELQKLGLQIAATKALYNTPGASGVNGEVAVYPKQILPGVDNVVLIGGGAAAVLLVVVLLSRK